MKVFAIKLRQRGQKRWGFLTDKGGVNYLRIYAARFPEAAKAQAVIDENTADNPEWEWRVVAL